MGKKIIIGIILAVGIFHIAWYAGSRIYQNPKLPDDKVLREYQDKMIKQMKMNVDRSVMEETYINANGNRLHLIITATGKNAPTLVFIPGTSVYAKVFAQFGYDMYKQGFNVIGFDPRGHGQSSGPRGNYTINELVDDTLAVMKYTRNRFGDKVALAGSSQGGMTAFYAAARDDSINAVVCHNIANLNGKDNIILSLIRPPQFLVPFCIFIMNIYGNYSFPISLYLDLTKEKFPDGTDAATLIKHDPLAVSWITFRALNSLLRTDMVKPVEKIKVPVMLIHAGKDNIFPQAYVESIYNRLTCKKKYLLLKNAEHLVMTNNVPEIVPPIAAWLKDIMR
ncbi:MAG: alpha/beta fold hydrolase [Syntrophaceae bacterium]|nr:alpha/beta fold hydrolase [Syntrophaceae bacterium]